MRNLVPVSLGFAAGCGLCVYSLVRPQWLWIGMILVLGILLLFAGKSTLLRSSALMLLGLGLSFGWYLGYSHFYLDNAMALDGKTETAVLRASDYSRATDYGRAVDAVLEREGHTYPVKVYLEAGEELSPGTELAGSFRFRVTVPGGKEEATSHSGKGVFLLAYQEETLVIHLEEPRSLREWASVLRRHIKDLLEATLPEDSLHFAKALLLGDTYALSYKVDTDLKLSGIRHVAAVSGLHVSILFALISMVTFRKRFLTAALGFPALLLFAAVAGFSPSVTRACVMSALMLGAMLANREYDGPSSLAFAVLVMLAVNPYAVTSVSLQLSVASVAGIFLFAPAIRSWLTEKLGKPREKSWKTRLVSWVSGSVSVSLSAMTLTTPLCAWYFGTVSLVGVVTNLLTLWVISFAFYGILGVCVAGFFWKSGAMLLGKLVAWPIRFVLAASDILADVPLTAVYTESGYIAAWLIFVYFLLVVFLLSRRKQPRELFCCACIGLCAALLASWWTPPEETRITVLDVGQGQCVLLQNEGRSFLVDCGGDSDTMTADIAAEALLSRGINRLDGMILTHLDRDHAGAAGNFLSRVKTDLLVLPPVYSPLPEETSAQILYADADLMLSWGNTVLRVFASEFPGQGNENSLCILFDTEKCDILITGDRDEFGERMLLRFHEIPDVDVLMAGHHGAKSSTCEELLSAVRPEIVCISVGEDNVYGHPAPELLERLAQFGCAVYRTDLNGTITIRR